MTRDEYDALPFDEAKVEFHRNPAEGVTYVTMNWSGTPIDEHTASDDGIKFIVSNRGGEFIHPRRETRALEKEVVLSADEATALAAWSAETLRLGGCSGYGPKFDDAMKVAHWIRAIVGPSDEELLEEAKAKGADTDG